MTSVVGRSYARALFEAAREDGTLDRVEEELSAARGALFDDAATRAVMTNRLIGRPTKKAAIAAGLEGTAAPLLLRFLGLLVDRGRMGLLGEISEEFGRLARLARGVRRVAVRSAFPLDTATRTRLARSLERRYGGTVDIVEEPGAPLIGGLATESEGEEIAFSIEAQLRDLRGGLAGGAGGGGGR